MKKPDCTRCIFGAPLHALHFKSSHICPPHSKPFPSSTQQNRLDVWSHPSIDPKPWRRRCPWGHLWRDQWMLGTGSRELFLRARMRYNSRFETTKCWGDIVVNDFHFGCRCNVTFHRWQRWRLQLRIMHGPGGSTTVCFVAYGGNGLQVMMTK